MEAIILIFFLKLIFYQMNSQNFTKDLIRFLMKDNLLMFG